MAWCTPSLSTSHMGWQRRRKSEHYQCLQGYVDEIAEILEIDSWHLMSTWFVSEDKCLEKDLSTYPRLRS